MSVHNELIINYLAENVLVLSVSQKYC